MLHQCNPNYKTRPVIDTPIQINQIDLGHQKVKSDKEMSSAQFMSSENGHFWSVSDKRAPPSIPKHSHGNTDHDAKKAKILIHQCS